MDNIKVLDLFCGCGGMSWGLNKAGFEVVAGIDVWDVALQTYGLNHPKSKAINIDLTNSSPQEILKDNNINPSEIDVITGGPPCQGFSKNTPATWRFLEDPRNQLYKEYLKFVDYIRPKVVIIENVAEIYNAFEGHVRTEIINQLSAMGYTVETKIIHMERYGIPQRRRRCFFLASRIGRPWFPQESNKIVTAWEAISDLPVVNQGEGFDGMEYTIPPQNSYQVKMRLSSADVFNHIANKMTAIQTERISSIGPGQGLKDIPPNLQVKGGYSGAYGRLDFTSPAPTITRWVFHVGSGRFAHPRENRGLTMREAARLQSFSDDFHFSGTRTEQAGQIGNAVPPLFMEKLGNEIKKLISGVQEYDLQPDLFQGV